MQLAKNLYLAREKTLSRKLQEAVLTLLLEQSLTKEQILELYLNVIEFAPGVYGIGPAADHYFHTLPERSIARAGVLSRFDLAESEDRSTSQRTVRCVPRGPSISIT